MLLLQHGAVRKKVNQAMRYSLLLNRIAEILCTNDDLLFSHLLLCRDATPIGTEVGKV